MANYTRLTNLQKEMHFTMDLWKLVLEIEELVRNHYVNLAEKELYERDKEDRNHPF